MSNEQLHAQFFFEQAKLLTDTWLRRVKVVCSRCDIQSMVGNRKEVSELLEFQLCVP